MIKVTYGDFELSESQKCENVRQEDETERKVQTRNISLRIVGIGIGLNTEINTIPREKNNMNIQNISRSRTKGQRATPTSRIQKVPSDKMEETQLIKWRWLVVKDTGEITWQLGGTFQSKIYFRFLCFLRGRMPKYV